MSLNINRYRDKLHALRAHLDAHVPQLVDDFPDPADAAERANQQTEVAVNIGLATHAAGLRKEIDNALARIDAGTFAICENCRRLIDTARLSAIPYARYCIHCERGIEQEEPI